MSIGELAKRERREHDVGGVVEAVFLHTYVNFLGMTQIQEPGTRSLPELPASALQSNIPISRDGLHNITLAI
jgi:hypothetical protein